MAEQRETWPEFLARVAQNGGPLETRARGRERRFAVCATPAPGEAQKALSDALGGVAAMFCKQVKEEVRG